jgi:hypothetical protein
MTTGLPAGIPAALDIWIVKKRGKIKSDIKISEKIITLRRGI